MEDLNLHFTGDIHAVGAATNLLAAMIDAHLFHGNELGIDPETITWRRALDVNDRTLRRIVTGLGPSGVAQSTGFDITAASETMGILATAGDLLELRVRLGRIRVGRSFDGAPVTAEDLGAAGAMAVLLKDALKPNLIQTLEGVPAIVHAVRSRTSLTGTTRSSPTCSHFAPPISWSPRADSAPTWASKSM